MKTLLLLLLCAVSAHATTINLATGRAYMDGNQGSWSTCVTEVGLGNPTCNHASFFALPLDGTEASRNHVAQAIIGGVLYVGPQPIPVRLSLPDNMLMNFTYTPIPDAVPSLEERATSPFTMTGTLSMFDPNGAPAVFDLTGQGTLERFWRPVFGTPFLRVQFNFEEPAVKTSAASVPEPGSVWMLAAGLVMLAIFKLRLCLLAKSE